MTKSVFNRTGIFPPTRTVWMSASFYSELSIVRREGQGGKSWIKMYELVHETRKFPEVEKSDSRV